MKLATNQKNSVTLVAELNESFKRDKRITITDHKIPHKIP